MEVCFFDKDSLASKGFLVITGVTGWVGRTALYELQKLLSEKDFIDRVRPFASKKGLIALKADTSPQAKPLLIKVQPLHQLEEFAQTNFVQAIFHAAFLTRDRLNEVGMDKYVTTNRWITSQVALALGHSPATRLVIISSGAASSFDGKDLDDEQYQSDIYGFLKHEEEFILKDLANSLVLRIYALSGCFIRKPERFALGNFLLSALKKDSIVIQSKNPVLRSYGNASDISSFAWRWLLSSNLLLDVNAPIATANLKVDLLTLAHKITELYNLPPIKQSVDVNAPPNSYVADSKSYLNALNKYGLTPKSLELQLLDTVQGLLAPSDRLVLK